MLERVYKDGVTKPLFKVSESEVIEVDGWDVTEPSKCNLNGHDGRAPYSSVVAWVIDEELYNRGDKVRLIPMCETCSKLLEQARVEDKEEPFHPLYMTFPSPGDEDPTFDASAYVD